MSDGGSGPNGECSRDADCVNSALGENGRCLQLGPLPGYTCSYDTCFADSTCAKDSVCQCRNPATGAYGNYCTAHSNCRIDADCGSNGYCSPSQSHTPDDECLNDTDCAAGTHCDFDVNEKHWVCGNWCGPVPP